MPRTSTRTTSSQTRPIPHIMPPMPSIMSFHCIGLRRLSADLVNCERFGLEARHAGRAHRHARQGDAGDIGTLAEQPVRSEENTSELQSLMRISYAVLCLKKKKQK